MNLDETVIMFRCFFFKLFPIEGLEKPPFVEFLPYLARYETYSL